MNQKKERYSLKQNIQCFARLIIYIWEKNKKIYAFMLLYFPAYILVNLLQVYLPKAVLAELENKQTAYHFTFTLTALFIALFIALFLRDKSRIKIENGNILIAQEMNMEYCRKFLYVEYPNLENPDFFFHRDNAKIALFGRGRDDDSPGMNKFLKILSAMTASLGTAIIYIVIISRLSPLLTIAILATAALDPLAENDIYLKYAAFSEGKTSFFVSHRLSSTRFCDKILLLNNGSITESGTHNALLAQGGLYAQMFTLQSRYYKK